MIRLLKSYYHRMPIGLKDILRPLILMMLLPMAFTLRWRDWYIRMTRTNGVILAAARAQDSCLRNIFAAHALYAMYASPSPQVSDKIASLLFPLAGTGKLSPYDYSVLCASLIHSGKYQQAQDALGALTDERGRPKSPEAMRAIALLAIALDKRDTALRYANLSGDSWLKKYATRLYGTDASSSSTINLGLLSYQTPLDTPLNSNIGDYINPNIGDYIQTLSVMRHIARFYDADMFSCPDSLHGIFDFLSNSWEANQRFYTSSPVNILTIDRDCARTSSDVWLPFFGWFGKEPDSIPMTFPMPSNIRPIFFSFHLNNISLLTPALRDYLKRYEPIGCRDRNTYNLLAQAGVKAFFSGCVSVTLDLPKGIRSPVPELYPRSECYSVDASDGSRIQDAALISHEDWAYASAPFPKNIERSLDLLLSYAQAKRVVTSRLHCYLPCRALEAPVEFDHPNPTDIRFDGLIDATDDELNRMSGELTHLLAEMFALILAGESEERVYSAWKSLTMPLAERDERNARRSPLFHRSPKQGLDDARKEESVPVAFAFDRNMLEYVPNVIRSIEAGASAETRYHLLTRGISSEDVTNLRTMFPDQTIVWRRMDEYLKGAQVNLNEGITISTMDRLFLPDLFPDIDKMIYLDVDLIVLGDISELYRIPLGDSPLGAVAENRPLMTYIEGYEMSHLRNSSKSSELLAELNSNVSLHSQMFNAGVLLFSLEAMRKDRFAKYAVRNAAKFGFDDQTLLNIYASEDFTRLPPEWNTFAFPHYQLFGGPQTKIVHWVGRNKPWVRTGFLSLDGHREKTKRLWKQFSS